MEEMDPSISSKVSKSFREKHVMDDAEFNSFFASPHLDDFETERLRMFRPEEYRKTRKNTIIRQTDADNLKTNSVFDSDSEMYISNDKMDLIQVDTFEVGNEGIQMKKGFLRFTVDEQGKIVHMEPPLIVE